MSIVKCDNCGQHNRVSDDAKSARCGRCKTALPILEQDDGWADSLAHAAKVMKDMPAVAVPVGAAATAHIGELDKLLRDIGEIVNSTAPADMTHELSEIATRLSLAGYLDDPDTDGVDPDGDEGEDDDG